MSVASTSTGDTQRPPTFSMSSDRPQYQKYPSASWVYLSPVRSHSPCRVCRVFSGWFQ